MPDDSLIHIVKGRVRSHTRHKWVTQHMKVEVEHPPSGSHPTQGDASLRRVFVVGCPRSGTTWLQLLLAQHPAIRTSWETDVFRRYVASLEGAWEWEQAGGWSHSGPVGVAGLISREEFFAWLRALPDMVFEAIRGDGPGVNTVVEKTPLHVQHSSLIRRFYPEARFIHLIRDPRSVVSSLMHASRAWRTKFASTNPIDEARRWKTLVEAGREIGGVTEHYREVRYEALLADTSAELASLLGWLELPFDEATCAEIAEACRIDRLRSGASDAEVPWAADSRPEGFYRRGEADAWREELSRREVQAIEYITGDLMDELGYERTISHGRRPPRLVLRQGLEWRVERLARGLERLQEFLKRI